MRIIITTVSAGNTWTNTCDPSQSLMRKPSITRDGNGMYTVPNSLLRWLMKTCVWHKLRIASKKFGMKNIFIAKFRQ